MTFLEKLDMLMQQQGLRKSDLSRKSGIPYTTIDGWYKRGYKEIKVTTLQKLSDTFNVGMNFWVEDDSSLDTKNKEPPAPEGAEGEVVSVEEIETLISGLIRAGYIRNRSELTKEDFVFVNHLIALAGAWFARKR